MRRLPTSVFNLALTRESSERDWCGSPEVLRDMLAAGARWESLGDNLGRSLEQLAAHADCLAVALDAGLSATDPFDVPTVAINGAAAKHRTTLLHAAARSGAEDSVRLLIERGASLEAPDSDGFTPLLAAIQAGREAACRCLMEAGARIDAHTTDGRGRAALAAETGHAAWVRGWSDEAYWPAWVGRYPPSPGGRHLGEWYRGDPSHPVPLTLREDYWPIFAWREIDGGIALRMVSSHPKLRGYTQVVEITLLDDGNGHLVQKSENGMPPPSVPGGFIWWRPGSTPYNATEDETRRIAQQSAEETATALRQIRSGDRYTLYLSGPGRESLPDEILAERRWRSASMVGCT